MKKSLVSLALVALCSYCGSLALGEEGKDDRRLAIADGALKLTVPEGWKRKQPQNRIIEHEFSVPPSEGDENPGRVTVMGAGGSIDDNIARWVGQFSQPDGGETKAKQEKLQIGGEDVYLVDISGTFRDQPGPFSGAPAVEREKYRMLAAIISSKKLGNYFIKFYGPQHTVADNAKGFDSMVKALDRK